MNCPEIRNLLNAHLDEELDVVNDAAVAAHLENCPACAGAALVLAEHRGLLQEKLTRHRAPPDLAAQIRAALPASPRTTPTPSAAWWLGWSRMGALVACCAIALAVGFSWGGRQARFDVVAAEMTAAHVRARLTGHVIDVESSDRHTVKPWFAGKVDFAPVDPTSRRKDFRSSVDGWNGSAAAPSPLWCMAGGSIASMCTCGVALPLPCCTRCPVTVILCAVGQRVV